MDKFVQYFKDNTKLLTVSIIALAVCLVIAIIIIICKKAVSKKRNAEIKKLSNDSENKDNAEVVNENNAVEDGDNQVENNAVEENPTEEDEEKEGLETSENVEEVLEKTAEIENQSAEQAENSDEPTDEEIEHCSDASANEISDNDETDEKIENVSADEAPDNDKTVEEKQSSEIDSVKEQAVTEEINEEQKQKKPLNKTVNKEKQPKANTRYAGKWVIIFENNRYSAELRASNAEILLRTESYSALSGIKSGIETIKNNIEKNNISVSMDKNGNFFFKIYSSSTRLLCVSEGYTTKISCEKAMESVRRFAKTAIIVREEKSED